MAKQTREEYLASRKLYREKNKEKIRAYNKKYKEANRHRLKTYPDKPGKHFKRTYGITEEDYQRMLVEQDYVCKICLQPETSKRNDTVKRLAVDHCHTTGEVRGLLCSNCNTTLGKYNDSPDMFKRFADYLTG